MTVLLDEMMPVELIDLLPGHKVNHVILAGWRHLSNGALLELAESNGFEVFVTRDAGIPFQQNLSMRSIKVVVLRPKDPSLPALLALAPALRSVLERGSLESVTRLPEPG
jgi:hypothetical protein